MKLWLVLSAAAGLGQVLLSWTAGLGDTADLIIKTGAAAGILAAGWRWLVGPCFRQARKAFEWVRERLELIVHVDERLDGIDERLERGEKRFAQIEAVLDVVRDESRLEVQAALREGRVVSISPDGGIERRSMASGGRRGDAD